MRRCRDSPSLRCTSSLSIGSEFTGGNNCTAKEFIDKGDAAKLRTCSSGVTKYSQSTASDSVIDAKSTTSSALMELINDDNNACECEIPNVMGIDDASLASDHGLLNVKNEDYWFEEESDPSDHEDENEESSDESSAESDSVEESSGSGSTWCGEERNVSDHESESMESSDDDSNCSGSTWCQKESYASDHTGKSLECSDDEDTTEESYGSGSTWSEKESYPSDHESESIEHTDEGSTESQSTEGDSVDESDGSTKISEEVEDKVICDRVKSVSTEDSEDSLINGVITIDLQPKISAPNDHLVMCKESLGEKIQREDEEFQSKLKEQSWAAKKKFSQENDDEESTVSNKDHAPKVDEIETSKNSTSSTTCKKGLTVSIPRDGDDLNESKSESEMKHAGNQRSEVDNANARSTINIPKDTIKDSRAASSKQYQPQNHYTSPRQQLAHKCLQNALKVIQREDAANASIIAALSKAELHSLINTGCAMMLKKKKEEDKARKEKQNRERSEFKMCEESGDDEEQDDRSTTCECDKREETDDVDLDGDEQRDDESTPRECGNEQRDIIHSGSTAGAPSLVSYIGTVADTSVGVNSTSQPSTELPLTDTRDTSDSQYLQADSDSTTGLSYIGTAVVQGTPPKSTLTQLTDKDRVTDAVPPYNTHLDEAKLLKNEDIDLIQVETTPTDDETISLDVAGSNSFDSVRLSHQLSSTPKSDHDMSMAIRNSPSQESIDEKNDTLSPLPADKNVMNRSCYSPADSYATSMASNASTSVSDVFGMLRTSLTRTEKNSDSSSTDEESEVMVAISSSVDENDAITKSTSAEESEAMLAADLSLVASSMRGTLTKKKRSKSMTSMHNDRATLTLGNALMATNIFTPPRTHAKTLATPSEQSDFNYGSIGATFSPLRIQQTNRPQSVVFGAVTSPTPSMFSGYTDSHEERTFLSIAKDIETNPSKIAHTANAPITKDEMKVLTIAEEMIADESSDSGSETSCFIKEQIALPATKVNSQQKKYTSSKSSCFHEYFGDVNANSSLSERSDPTELYERVKWLEKVLGVNHGGANKAFECEIIDLKEKLSIVERRLEEEMELKAVANKTVKTLQASLGGLNEEKTLVDKCLRNEVSSLKSQLKFHKMKADTAESDVKAALASVLDLGIACERKDAEITKLAKEHEQSLERQRQLENDLVACAEGNDALRSRVLALVSDGSTKEHTLISALTQLKSLSENFYHTKIQLEEEKNKRRDEVEALQFSLDDVSRKMVLQDKKMHTLESANECLRAELMKLRTEKEQTQRMRRSARGF